MVPPASSGPGLSAQSLQELFPPPCFSAFLARKSFRLEAHLPLYETQWKKAAKKKAERASGFDRTGCFSWCREPPKPAR